MLLLFVSRDMTAQAVWDGEAGDGLWESAANWVGNLLPLATDDIILDNSLVTGNYTVALPGGNAAITVKSMVIAPAAGTSIQLVLPVSNNALPAFTATGPGDGITINNGGLLLNASGSTGGVAIVINDSIRINNGGQYTHNSRSSHAALVTALAKGPGTEKGIFKFDAPGGGYTFASTGRNYGTLVLSAAASGGTQAYATSAAAPLTVNGDFIIETGVTVNLDITAATIIKGDYIQDGGVLNLASQPNNNMIYMNGQILQNAGIITETSSGLPVIEFNGSLNQPVMLAGGITNNVALNINNAAGITLLGNLSLPYRLSLLNGIVQSRSFLITLLPSCIIIADSTSNRSFITGALRKEGLSVTPHFLFPVGKDGTQRWLALSDATGNYTVEFFKSNPAALSTVNGSGIHHISGLEYWTVKADVDPVPAAIAELSFDNVNSGGVTDMAALEVAQLVAAVWTNRGNMVTTGAAGLAGSVLSNPLTAFDAQGDYLSLASSQASQNPLPLEPVFFSVSAGGHTAALAWTIDPAWQAAGFELQSSPDGLQFLTFLNIEAIAGQSVYRYTDKRPLGGGQYYRVKTSMKNGSIFYSKTCKMDINSSSRPDIQVRPSVATNNTRLYLFVTAPGQAQVSIINAGGRVIRQTAVFLQQGNNNIPLIIENFPAGLYWIRIVSAHEEYTTRFIKPI
ncbi:MAG: T9SS type A sorting domain-containing protein [Bacteroidota bacterium]